MKLLAAGCSSSSYTTGEVVAVVRVWNSNTVATPTWEAEKYGKH